MSCVAKYEDARTDTVSWRVLYTRWFFLYQGGSSASYCPTVVLWREIGLSWRIRPGTNLAHRGHCCQVVFLEPAKL
jgi:hypothetical protein